MIDLKKLLNEVIAEYGINEGYEVPEIVWSDEILLTRYGEYQFWTNKIIISKLLNNSKISLEAIKSVIYHEYTHQLYQFHDNSFYDKMKQFPGYEDYQNELETFFNEIQDFPKSMKNPLPLDKEKEIVFCLLPLDKENNEAYINRFTYCNHHLFVTTSKTIPDSFCNSTAEQVVWLVYSNKKMYAVGWGKKVDFFAKKQKLFANNQWISEAVSFNGCLLQKDIKLIPASNAFTVLDRKECPESLIKNGICHSMEIDKKIGDEIIDMINEYDCEYLEIGILDTALDCIPGIVKDNVDEILKIHNTKYYNSRDFLVGNKAVMLEKSYRTYVRRGLAFANTYVFDRAISDLNTALQYNVNSKELSKKDAKYILEALQDAEKEMKDFNEVVS